MKKMVEGDENLSVSAGIVTQKNQAFRSKREGSFFRRLTFPDSLSRSPCLVHLFVLVWEAMCERMQGVNAEPKRVHV